jgi:hypothetical protein
MALEATPPITMKMAKKFPPRPRDPTRQGKLEGDRRLGIRKVSTIKHNWSFITAI